MCGKIKESAREILYVVDNYNYLPAQKALRSHL